MIHDKIKNVCKSFTVILKLFFRIHLLNLKELWTMDFAQLTKLRTNFVLVFESPLIPFTSSFFKSNFVLFGRCRNMLTTKAAILLNYIICGFRELNIIQSEINEAFKQSFKSNNCQPSPPALLAV